MRGTAEIQRWFAHFARGKVCDFAFLTSSGGKFYEFFYDNCAIHSPANRENRGGAWPNFR